MADEFTLTKSPVRLTSAGKQPPIQALDVSEYDEINALFGLLAVEDSSSGVAAHVLTGMQNETEEGWVTLMSFTSATTAGTYDLKNATTGLLEYIRWSVTSLGGATSIVITVNGMLRVKN